MKTRAAATLFVCLLTLSALAQSPAMKPFEINMDRVRVSSFGGNFGTTDTYLIPTVRVRLSVQGSVWAQKGGAKAHGKYWVFGADHDVMQDVAKKLQDDLASKMRAAGYTVLTYEDVKSEPDVAGQSLDKVDSRYGLPTSGGFGMPVTFIDATPTDAQSFAKPIQGPAWAFRGVAKAKNLTVIVPELTFTTPQMWGQVERSAWTDSAGVSMDPRMIFEGATVVGVTPKGGGPAIQVQQHGKRLAADVAGKIVKASENKLHVEHVSEFTSADYVMDFDKPVFTDGILRVGFALNDVIVAQVKKDHH
jgi:hypothetical protein